MKTPRPAVSHSQNTCHAFALLAARLATAAIILVVLCSAAFAEAPTQDRRAILRQAAIYQQQFRSGALDNADAFVALLEAATTTQPGDADLWYTLGVAYFNAAAAIALDGGDMAAAAPAYQKGTAALEQALKLDPDHPEAIAIRAGTRLMMAAFARKPEVIAMLQQTAATEMNRAVELDPKSKRARLQRAFSGPTLPAALRNHAHEAADLDYLITAASRSRAGDYIRIMRGDLEAELGRFDAARGFYQGAARSTTPGAGMAQARLAALGAGGVPLDAIKELRAAAGAQCTMCHAD